MTSLVLHQHSVSFPSVFANERDYAALRSRPDLLHQTAARLEKTTIFPAFVLRLAAKALDHSRIHSDIEESWRFAAWGRISALEEQSCLNWLSKHRTPAQGRDDLDDHPVDLQRLQPHRRVEVSMIEGRRHAETGQYKSARLHMNEALHSMSASFPDAATVQSNAARLFAILGENRRARLLGMRALQSAARSHHLPLTMALQCARSAAEAFRDDFDGIEIGAIMDIRVRAVGAGELATLVEHEFVACLPLRLRAQLNSEVGSPRKDACMAAAALTDQGRSRSLLWWSLEMLAPAVDDVELFRRAESLARVGRPSEAALREELSTMRLQAWRALAFTHPLLAAAQLDSTGQAIGNDPGFDELSASNCHLVASGMAESARSLAGDPSSIDRAEARAGYRELPAAEDPIAVLLYRRSIQWFDRALSRSADESQLDVGECRSDRALATSSVLMGTWESNLFAQSMSDFRTSFREGLLDSSLAPVVFTYVQLASLGHRRVSEAEWRSAARGALATALWVIRSARLSADETSTLVIAACRLVCRMGVSAHAARLVVSARELGLSEDASHAVHATGVLFGVDAPEAGDFGRIPIEVLSELLDSRYDAAPLGDETAGIVGWLGRIATESLENQSPDARLETLGMVLRGTDRMAAFSPDMLRYVGQFLIRDFAEYMGKPDLLHRALHRWARVCRLLDGLAAGQLPEDIQADVSAVSRTLLRGILDRPLALVFNANSGGLLSASLATIVRLEDPDFVARFDATLASRLTAHYSEVPLDREILRRAVHTMAFVCATVGVPCSSLVATLDLARRLDVKAEVWISLAAPLDMVLDAHLADRRVELGAADMIARVLADPNDLPLDELVTAGHVASTLLPILGTTPVLRFAALVARRTQLELIGGEQTSRLFGLISRASTLLLNIGRRTGSVEMLDAGISLCAESLRLEAMPPKSKNSIATRFAQLLHERADLSGADAAERDNRQALELATYAERAYTGPPGVYRESLLALAIGARRVGAIDQDRGMLLEALSLAEELAERTDSADGADVEQHGVALATVATNYFSLYSVTGEEDFARSAARHFVRALSQARVPSRHAGVRASMLVQLLSQSKSVKDEFPWPDLEPLVRSALEGTPPTLRYFGFRNLAYLAFDREAWEDCTEATLAALNAMQRLVDDESNRVAQLRRLDDAEDLAFIGLTAALRLGSADVLAAIGEASQALTLTEGIDATRLSSERLDADAVASSRKLINSWTELEKHRIGSEADNSTSTAILDSLAAVASLRSPAGSLRQQNRASTIRIIPAGSELIIVSSSDGSSTYSTVEGTLLRRFIESTERVAASTQLGSRRPLAPLALDSALEEWMSQFAQILETADPQLIGTSDVLLIPHGYVALGPVWSVAADFFRTAGRAVPVVAPFALDRSKPSDNTAVRTAQVVPIGSDNAESVDLEATLIRRALLNADVGTRATLDEVTRGEVLHLGGHLEFGSSKRIDSAYIAGRESAPERLGIDRLLELRPKTNGIVTLSTCQGGWVDRWVLSEARSLVSVLLQIGWGSVVAANWPLPDLLAAFGMVRFYELLASGQSAASSLLATQDEIRHSDLRGLASSMPELPWPEVLVERGAGNFKVAACPSLWSAFQLHGYDFKLV